MKKYLVLYAVAVTALFVCSHRRYRAENRRLVQNQTALAAEVAHYRTQAGQEAASAQVLRLRCGEFEALRAADAEEIRRLGLKIRRLVAAGLQNAAHAQRLCNLIVVDGIADHDGACRVKAVFL